MWTLLAFLFLAGCAGVHLWWRRRFRAVKLELSSQAKEADALRIQHERVAQQGAAQQQALFNSMVEGLLVLDEADRVQLTNQALQQMLGASASIKGATLMEAFRMHELVEIVERAHDTGPVLGIELQLQSAQKRRVQVNAVPIHDEQRRRQGTVVVFHDVSRIKELENTRREFVANVSHELRTPLSLIKGYVETLIDGAKDDPVVATRFLQTILKHADRLTFLIEDLLTISQLESGQSMLNLQPVTVREAVARVFDDLAARAAERQVVFENTVDPGLMARADRDRLEQVLFNLADNAIKYGRDGGHVSVGACVSGEKRVEVWVRDDGPGIPEESLERVFERFYRVDRARSREQGGTGLGLSIVKHIVQSHGGEVWARSVLGSGTTFYFTLPLEQRDNSERARPGDAG